MIRVNPQTSSWLTQHPPLSFLYSLCHNIFKSEKPTATSAQSYRAPFSGTYSANEWQQGNFGGNQTDNRIYFTEVSDNSAHYPTVQHNGDSMIILSNRLQLFCLQSLAACFILCQIFFYHKNYYEVNLFVILRCISIFYKCITNQATFALSNVCMMFFNLRWASEV